MHRMECRNDLPKLPSECPIFQEMVVDAERLQSRMRPLRHEAQSEANSLHLDGPASTLPPSTVGHLVYPPWVRCNRWPSLRSPQIGVGHLRRMPAFRYGLLDTILRVQANV